MEDDMLRLKQRPLLTLVVVAITVVTSAIVVASPTALAHFERTPAGSNGEWWRTLTSLFTQDDAGGAASNLLFTVAVGVVAEQVTTRWRWLACYLFAGIVGELVGYAWQPTGAGNSVAVCGIAAVVAVACWRGDPRLPIFGAMVLVLWDAVLLSTWTWPAAIVGGVVAMVVIRLGVSRWRHVNTVAVAATVATGVVLACVQNIHGAALLAGLAVAALFAYMWREPVTAAAEPDPRLSRPAGSPR
jgi:membrane associated rhomboid family serine protease